MLITDKIPISIKIEHRTEDNTKYTNKNSRKKIQIHEKLILKYKKIIKIKR